MRGFNQVTFMGNLTKDPVRRETKNGRAVASFSIAVNEDWRGKDGQEHKDVTFVEVVVFGAQAEPCLAYLTKGSPVFVQGKLKISPYVGKDGVQRQSTQTVARTVQFLNGRSAGNSSSNVNGNSAQNSRESRRNEVPSYDMADYANPADPFPDFDAQMESFGVPFDIDPPAPVIRPDKTANNPQVEYKRVSPSGQPINRLNKY